MNIQWQIVPFVGINQLRFGMSRTQVRNMLHSPFEPFRKGPYSSNDTDSYDELGFHLYYDHHDNLEFIEAFSPCDIRLWEMIFLERTLSQVLAEAQERDYTATLAGKDSLCDFAEQGIALYVEDEIVKATSIYRKGYYES